MAARTTDSVQRVDLLLAQAEDFAELANVEEALARARQVIAYSELERKRTDDPRVREALSMRELLAEALIARLGGPPVRDASGRLRVQAEDALLPDSWD
ncbi:MAG TPA: hypothetical protein VIL20_10105 [Sandaracinaceae bacterium]